MQDAIAKALVLIEGFEGFSASPYRDGAGLWTIGFGSRYLRDETEVRSDTPPISRLAAEALLTSRIKNVIMPQVGALAGWNTLNINQKAACISLAYNIGTHAFCTSSVASAIGQREYRKASAAFMLYDKIRVSGKLTASPGLARRRQAEADLFSAPAS